MLRVHFKEREEVDYVLPDERFNVLSPEVTASGTLLINRERIETVTNPQTFQKGLVVTAREFVEAWGPASGWYRVENIAASSARNGMLTHPQEGVLP